MPVLSLMKLHLRLSATALLAALLITPAPVSADQPPAKDAMKRPAMDVRALLEKGQASGAWPEGMVIRLGACLGEPKVKTSGERVPVGGSETWEFTSNQVHRAAFEYKKDHSTYKRLESRPFDAKGLCKELLDGKAIEIHAEKGTGPVVGLVGSGSGRGSRNIEVELNGETILDLSETNGPFLKFYRETDARAFGALYERLASQARALFKAKADEGK